MHFPPHARQKVQGVTNRVNAIIDYFCGEAAPVRQPGAENDPRGAHENASFVQSPAPSAFA